MSAEKATPPSGNGGEATNNNNNNTKHNSAVGVVQLHPVVDLDLKPGDISEAEEAWEESPEEQVARALVKVNHEEAKADATAAKIERAIAGDPVALKDIIHDSAMPYAALGNPVGRDWDVHQLAVLDAVIEKLFLKKGRVLGPSDYPDITHELKVASQTEYELVRNEARERAVDKPRHLDVIRADEVELSRVRYLWDGRIPLGAMTLMPGEEGIGKTTVGVRIISDLTRGLLPGECYEMPWDVVVLSLEDGLNDVYAPRLREAGADMTRVHIVRGTIAEDGGTSPDGLIIPRDLQEVGVLVRDVGASLVWVDSLVTALPDGMKTISYKDTAKVLKALGNWAEAEDVAVVAPWHLNKSSGTSSALRVMDSRAFRTSVRSMLMVVKDPDAPEGETRGLVVLDKANGGTLNVPGLRYHIRSSPYMVEEVDEDTGEVYEVMASCGVVDWIDEVPAAVAQELVKASLDTGLTKENDPAGWLRDFLTEHGATAREEIIPAAGLAGFSESAIQRARRRLGVKTTEETGQKENGAPFRKSIWKLPAQSCPPSNNDKTDKTGRGV